MLQKLLAIYRALKYLGIEPWGSQHILVLRGYMERCTLQPKVSPFKAGRRSVYQPFKEKGSQNR